MMRDYAYRPIERTPLESHHSHEHQQEHSNNFQTISLELDYEYRPSITSSSLFALYTPRIYRRHEQHIEVLEAR